MDFAGKAAGDASTITADDVNALRGHGLGDTEIFHLVLAVAARCFFTTALDALGHRTRCPVPRQHRARTPGGPHVGRPVAGEA